MLNPCYDGAGGRNRTGTELPPEDFESSASTSFTTPARKIECICKCGAKVNNDGDGFVKSQNDIWLSFRRKPGSSYLNSVWTPAFAGVTELELLTITSRVTDNKTAISSI
jgi:hypothetical protein